MERCHALRTCARRALLPLDVHTGDIPSRGRLRAHQGTSCPAMAIVRPLGDMGCAEVLAQAPPSSFLLLLGKGFVHGRTLMELCREFAGWGSWDRGLPGWKLGIWSGTFSFGSLPPW